MELTIVGLLSDLEGTLTFKWDSDSTTININGNYAEGSGADYFKSFFNDFSSKDLSPAPEDSSPLAEALRKCVLMLGDEIIHENTYQEFFGGGFELIAYNDGQLKIVSDFAVVPYVINYENFKIKDFNLKRNIQQQRYEENILWISSSSFRAKEADSRYKNENRTELYALDSIHGKKTKGTLKYIELQDFKSKTICHYFHINQKESNRTLNIVDIFFNPKTDLIEFTSSKSGINITYSNEYIEMLEKTIEKSLADIEQKHK